jgi:hypothetical protein
MKRSTRWYSSLAAGLLIVLNVAVYGQNPCRVNGFNNARVTFGYSIIDGNQYTGLRSKLANSKFFNFNTGAVPFGITLQSGVPSFGPTTTSTLDVFVTGYTPTASYTAPELTNILNFVMSGGSIIVQADDTDHSITSLFGVTQVTNSVGGGSANQVIVDYDNPVTNGPFGRVERLVPTFNVGQFSGIPGNATTLARNIGGSTGGNTAAVVIFRDHALGPNSGRVVILNDADYVGDREIADPAGNDATVLFLNALAFACFIPDNPGGANYNTYYFPQVAFNGGFNFTAQSSNGTTGNTISNIQFNFFDDNGVTLAPSQDFTFSTESGNGTNSVGFSGTFSAPIQTGWAWVRSDDINPFFAQAKFVQFDAQTKSGHSDVVANPITAVGVPPAQPGRSFTLVGFLGPTQDIGIAFVALPTDPLAASIRLLALDFQGNQVGSTTTFTLLPGHHLADFIDHLVSVNRNLVNTNLSVFITSSQQIAVLGLASNDPGFKLSGIPTFPGRQALAVFGKTAQEGSQEGTTPTDIPPSAKAGRAAVTNR